MNIHIIKSPSVDMRYETLGDWYFDEDGDLFIKVANDVTELPTEDHRNLVALHELIEVLLCLKRGITQKMVDDFDMGIGKFVPASEEPGDHPEAPYGKEHRFAMLIEHLMAHELGVKPYGIVR